MTKSIKVQNIKCGGCANSIQKKLSAIEGVSDVKIDVEDGMIFWTDIENDQSVLIKETLAKMGYPEGNSTLIQTAKSYVSCAIGRLDK